MLGEDSASTSTLKYIVPFILALASGGVGGYGTGVIVTAERFTRLETQMVQVQKGLEQQMSGYEIQINALRRDVEKRMDKLEDKLDRVLEKRR